MLNRILLVDKPKDITSFDVIRKLKRILPKKTKIGHAGTLDPFASGLLIIGIGNALKEFNQKFIKLDKEYIVTAKFGEITDTLDKTGKVIKSCSFDQINQDKLEKAIKEFSREYLQIPPIYSAIKYCGKPLYKYIRENKLSQKELENIVKDKAKIVSLYNLELLDYDAPFFEYKAHVSSGTYIRALTNDIANKLNSCATTYELIRTKIGNYHLNQAIELNKINTQEDIASNLI